MIILCYPHQAYWLLRTNEGQLRRASEEGNIEVVTKLLGQGVHADATDRVSLTTLLKDHLKMISAL